MYLKFIGGGLCSAILGLIIASSSASPELKVNKENIQDFAKTGKLEVIESSNSFGYHVGCFLFLTGSASLAYGLLKNRTNYNQSEIGDKEVDLDIFNIPVETSNSEPTGFEFPDLKEFRMPDVPQIIGDIKDATVDAIEDFSDFVTDSFISGELIDLPVIDLAANAAKVERSFIIGAIPGSGKTSTLRHLMYNLIDNNKGRLDLQIIDCKNEDDGFSGLEKTSLYSTFVDIDESVNFSERVSKILKKTGEARQQKPLISIVDEYNNGLATVANYDRINKTNLLAMVKSNVLQIGTKGRSKAVKMVLTTHSHSTRDLGITENNMHNFYFAFQAISHSCDAIKAILSDPRSIIVDADIRKNLQAQLKTYLSEYSTGDSVICLSNVPCENGHGWRLFKLPDYSKDPDIKGLIGRYEPFGECVKEECLV